MKTLYLDCISGISGDMTLAALIDLGADVEYIKRKLMELPIDEFDLWAETVDKHGITAKKLHIRLPEGNHHEHDHEHGHDSYFHIHDEHVHEHVHGQHDHHHHEPHYGNVHSQHDHHHDEQADEQTHDQHNHQPIHPLGHTNSHSEHQHAHGHPLQTHAHSHEHHQEGHTHSHAHEHRKAATILEMIRESELPERVKTRSLAIFEAIAIAEGKIHGIDPSEVHFHEVGAMDSILDTIGICLALEDLGVDELLASPVPVGYGKMKMAHGLYPIPAPATAELLRGIPLAPAHSKGELTTPTGAGVLKALVRSFGPLENFTIDRIGYGAGTKDFAVPNVLRAFIGTSNNGV